MHSEFTGSARFPPGAAAFGDSVRVAMIDATTNAKPGGAEPLHFRRRHRLTQAREFAAVFEARVRKHAGPLTVFALPNGLPHARLGLSVGRRVGNAVVRHRLKRRLREAFRLHQQDLAGGLDYVIASRAHDPLGTDGYAALLMDAARRLEREWRKRGELGEADARRGS